MKQFFENYGMLLAEAVGGFLTLAVVFSIFINSDLLNSYGMLNLNQSVHGVSVEYVLPTVDEGTFMVENGVLNKGDTFNWKDYVTVSATNGDDLLNFITIGGETVDTSKSGFYTVTFTLNWNGTTIEKEADYFVREDL